MAGQPPSPGVEFLPFPPGEITTSLRIAVFEFCSTLDWVQAAYVCQMRRSDSAGEVVEEKLVAALLPDPAVGPAGDRSPRDEARGLFEVLPPASQVWGVMILADEAVERWKAFALCLFAR
jgi:hypothetical protein